MPLGGSRNFVGGEISKASAEPIQDLRRHEVGYEGPTPLIRGATLRRPAGNAAYRRDRTLGAVDLCEGESPRRADSRIAVAGRPVQQKGDGRGGHPASGLTRERGSRRADHDDTGRLRSVLALRKEPGPFSGPPDTGKEPERRRQDLPGIHQDDSWSTAGGSPDELDDEAAYEFHVVGRVGHDHEPGVGPDADRGIPMNQRGRSCERSSRSTRAPGSEHPGETRRSPGCTYLEGPLPSLPSLRVESRGRRRSPDPMSSRPRLTSSTPLILSDLSRRRIPRADHPSGERRVRPADHIGLGVPGPEPQPEAPLRSVPDPRCTLCRAT